MYTCVRVCVCAHVCVCVSKRACATIDLLHSPDLAQSDAARPAIYRLLSPLMYFVAGDRSTVTGEQWPVAAAFK